MDIASIHNIPAQRTAQPYELNGTSLPSKENEGSFGSILGAAMNMINETNDYQNAAEAAQIQFALGESTNTHSLSIAQQKANLALQYTVAVRDKVVEAYKEIMNMSI